MEFLAGFHPFLIHLIYMHLVKNCYEASRVTRPYLDLNVFTLECNLDLGLGRVNSCFIKDHKYLGRVKSRFGFCIHTNNSWIRNKQNIGHSRCIIILQSSNIILFWLKKPKMLSLQYEVMFLQWLKEKKWCIFFYLKLHYHVDLDRLNCYWEFEIKKHIGFTNTQLESNWLRTRTII